MTTQHNNRLILLIVCVFIGALVPIQGSVSAQNVEEIEVLRTEINPANNHTYHLLSASSWLEAAEAARGLDGYLVTVNNAQEHEWVFETFARGDDQYRHVWIGLSDAEQEGNKELILRKCENGFDNALEFMKYITFTTPPEIR